MLCDINVIIIDWCKKQSVEFSIDPDMSFEDFRYKCVAINGMKASKLIDYLYKFSQLNGVLQLKYYRHSPNSYNVNTVSNNVRIRTIKDNCAIQLTFIDYIDPDDRENLTSTIYLSTYDFMSGLNLDSPAHHREIFLDADNVCLLVDILYADLSDDERAAIKLPYLIET